MIQLLKRFYLSLFFGRRFFRALAGIALLFIVSFGIPLLFPVAQWLLLLFSAATAVDYFLLFAVPGRLVVTRKLPERFSNGDDNEISWTLTNGYQYALKVQLIDEFPQPLQIRDFGPHLRMPPGAGSQ